MSGSPGTSKACRAFDARLALLAGNDLPREEVRETWQHLADCARCRRELVAYRDVRRVLAEFAEDGRRCELPPGFFDELRDSVLAAVERPPRRRAVARRRVLAVAGAAALFVTGWLLVPVLERGGRPRLLDIPAVAPGPAMVDAPGSELLPTGLAGQSAALRLLEETERLTVPEWLGAERGTDEERDDGSEDRDERRGQRR